MTRRYLLMSIVVLCAASAAQAQLLQTGKTYVPSGIAPSQPSSGCTFMTTGEREFIGDRTDLGFILRAKPSGVEITILALEFTSPNITKVTVTRDGKPIAAIKGDIPEDDRFAQQELTNRMGASRIVHYGKLMFPSSAFAPGGTVTVSAIPAIGSKISKTFNCAK